MWAGELGDMIANLDRIGAIHSEYYAQRVAHREEQERKKLEGTVWNWLVGMDTM